jgi:hypothetical protein
MMDNSEYYGMNKCLLNQASVRGETHENTWHKQIE